MAKNLSIGGEIDFGEVHQSTGPNDFWSVPVPFLNDANEPVEMHLFVRRPGQTEETHDENDPSVSPGGTKNTTVAYDMSAGPGIINVRRVVIGKKTGLVGTASGQAQAL